MNVWRRLVSWRLAVLFVALTLAAGIAWADVDQVRVKVGPANVYQRADTKSEVVMVAPEGTVLDVMKREGDWFWVILPRDEYGTRRGGYIAAYRVELIPRKGTRQGSPTASPMPGAPAFPAAAPPTAPAPKAAPAAAAKPARYLAGLGIGVQASSRAFADTAWFPMNDEVTTYHAYYATPSASAFDASLGLRLARSFALGVAYSRSSLLPAASITATVPHPLVYDTPRPASASGVGASRVEKDLHVQATWLTPLSRRVDLSIFGGPTFFFVTQDLVTLDAGSFRDTYPFDTVSMTGSFHAVRRSKTAVGANAGFDVTVMLWRYIGAGATARYAYGSADLPATMAGYALPVTLGGVQASGGLRLRF